MTTRDEVLAMAREAGIDEYDNGLITTDQFAERFAALAFEAGRKAEREECAKDKVDANESVPKKYQRIKDELNMDDTDAFTRAMCALFSIHEAYEETKAALERCQAEVHSLAANQIKA